MLMLQTWAFQVEPHIGGTSHAGGTAAAAWPQLDIYLEANNCLFSLNVKLDLTVGIYYFYKMNLITYLACAHPQHGEHDRGITRICKKLWGATKNTEGLDSYA